MSGSLEPQRSTTRQELYQLNSSEILTIEDRSNQCDQSGIVVTLRQVVSLQSSPATKLAEVDLKIPYGKPSTQVDLHVIYARAALLQKIYEVAKEESGDLLTKLLGRLANEGIEFSKQVYRCGEWTQQNTDWKAQIAQNGILSFVKRFHGSSYKLTDIDKSEIFVLQAGKLVKARL